MPAKLEIEIVDSTGGNPSPTAGIPTSAPLPAPTLPATPTLPAGLPAGRIPPTPAPPPPSVAATPPPLPTAGSPPTAAAAPPPLPIAPGAPPSLLAAAGGPAGSVPATPRVPLLAAANPSTATPPPLPAPPSGFLTGSPVAAFDRPTPVVIVGPKVLEVEIVGGRNPAGSKPKEDKEPPGFATRLLRGANTVSQRTGEVASGLADNRALPALSAATDAAAFGLGKLGSAGVVAGLGLKVFNTAVNAASETVNAFVARGRELSGFNGSLAAASAQADVRSLLADIREAADNGPAMAELIEKQNQLEITFREILLPIKKIIVEVLAGLMEVIAKTAAGILEGINDLLGTFRVRSDKIDRILKRIADSLGGDGDGAAFLDAWLKAFPGGMVGRPGGGPPGAPDIRPMLPADIGLGVPLVGGP